MAIATFAWVSSGPVILLGILALLILGIGQIFSPQLLIPYTVAIVFLLLWIVFDKGYSGWH